MLHAIKAMIINKIDRILTINSQKNTTSAKPIQLLIQAL
jgi:hypothetical protein